MATCPLSATFTPLYQHTRPPALPFSATIPFPTPWPRSQYFFPYQQSIFFQFGANGVERRSSVTSEPGLPILPTGDLSLSALGVPGAVGDNAGMALMQQIPGFPIDLGSNYPVNKVINRGFVCRHLGACISSVLGAGGGVGGG